MPLTSSGMSPYFDLVAGAQMMLPGSPPSFSISTSCRVTLRSPFLEARWFSLQNEVQQRRESFLNN